MAVPMSITIEGMLKSDGTIELRRRPGLPPGPVWVTLEAVSQEHILAEALPDQPWEDEALPAPFDLPLSGLPQPVNPQVVEEWLPHPIE